jgi:hypothetical protein
MAEPDKTDPGKYDRLKNVLDTLSKPTAFELGVVRALHDIHRRVIEEPWFGRTIHDVVSYYNQRLGEEHEKEQEPAREPAQHNVQQNTQENTQENKQEHEHDYSPDVFFGRDKATTERQQERERQEQQRTQERGRDIER